MDFIRKQGIDYPQIAIIVAAYNVEKFIERCIHSIQLQTYSNWKIYVVDDGSTDNTGIILKKLSHEEKRMEVIHTENKGLFRARKKAIDSVQECEFMIFLDSDDFFCERTLFQQCIDKLLNNDLDFLEFNFIVRNHQGFRANEEKQWTDKKEMTKSFLCGDCIDGNMTYSVYKTEIVKKYFKIYEYNNDEFFNKYRILMHSDKMAFLPIVGYYYFDNPNSQTHQNIQKKDFLYYKHASLFVNKISEHFTGLESECNYFQYKILLYLAAKVLKDNQSKNGNYHWILKKVKENGEIFKKNKYFSKRDYLKYWTIYLHLYSNIYKIYHIFEYAFLKHISRSISKKYF